MYFGEEDGEKLNPILKNAEIVQSKEKSDEFIVRTDDE